MNWTSFSTHTPSSIPRMPIPASHLSSCPDTRNVERRSRYMSKLQSHFDDCHRKFTRQIQDLEARRAGGELLNPEEVDEALGSVSMDRYGAGQ